jgi:hypothetical protein
MRERWEREARKFGEQLRKDLRRDGGRQKFSMRRYMVELRNYARRRMDQ